MSIKCKCCNYEMTTFEFIGHMTAELFLLFKEWIHGRGIFEGWEQAMLGFSNTMKIPCPTCQNFEGWAVGSEETSVSVKQKNNQNEQAHVK